MPVGGPHSTMDNFIARYPEGLVLIRGISKKILLVLILIDYSLLGASGQRKS